MPPPYFPLTRYHGAFAARASWRPLGVVEEHPKKADARAAIVAKRADALTEARRVVLSAWGGDARPRPFDGASCARCEARDVCRRPAVVPDAEADHP